MIGIVLLTPLDGIVGFCFNVEDVWCDVVEAHYSRLKAYSCVKAGSRGMFTLVVSENIYRAAVAIVSLKARWTCDMELFEGDQTYLAYVEYNDEQVPRPRGCSSTD